MDLNRIPTGEAVRKFAASRRRNRPSAFEVLKEDTIPPSLHDLESAASTDRRSTRTSATDDLAAARESRRAARRSSKSSSSASANRISAAASFNTGISATPLLTLQTSTATDSTTDSPFRMQGAANIADSTTDSPFRMQGAANISESTTDSPFRFQVSATSSESTTESPFSMHVASPGPRGRTSSPDWGFQPARNRKGTPVKGKGSFRRGASFKSNVSAASPLRSSTNLQPTPEIMSPGYGLNSSMMSTASDSEEEV
jgi:hypothetical protein